MCVNAGYAGHKDEQPTSVIKKKEEECEKVSQGDVEENQDHNSVT